MIPALLLFACGRLRSGGLPAAFVVWWVWTPAIEGVDFAAVPADLREALTVDVAHDEGSSQRYQRSYEQNRLH